MKNLTYLILFLISSAMAAPGKRDENVSPIIEAWVKITCSGTVTPVGQTIKVKPVMTYFIKTPANEPFPSLQELRNRNPSYFTEITKTCNDRRVAMVDLSNFHGKWLDWGTDHGYMKFEVGEEIITSNACRDVGHPCEKNVQCCGGTSAANALPTKGSYCSKTTNSCVSSEVIKL